MEEEHLDESKARETAETLIDVLRTSTPAAARGSFSSSTDTLLATKSHNNIKIRHGFAINGWGGSTGGNRHETKLEPISSDPGLQGRELTSQAQRLSTHLLQTEKRKIPQGPPKVSGDDQELSSRRLSPCSKRKSEPSCNSIGASCSSNTPTSHHHHLLLPNKISMTTIGFGIDNNPDASLKDATGAAKKAVQDALERSFFRSLQTTNGLSFQLKVELGVPSMRDTSTRSDTAETNGQPMAVDQASLFSVLPKGLLVLPLSCRLGGLFIPGGAPSCPSICTVVACITFESVHVTSQPSNNGPLPTASATASPCLETNHCAKTSIGGPSLPTIPHHPNLIEAPSTLSSKLLQNKSSTLPPIGKESFVPSILARNHSKIGGIQNVTAKGFPLPSPPVVYQQPGAETIRAVNPSIPPSKITTTVNPMKSGSAIEQSDPKQELDADSESNTETHNSIDLLAMISAQEINRRRATLSLPKSVLELNKTDSYKNGDRLLTPDGTFTATGLRHLQTFGYDKNRNLELQTEGERHQAPNGADVPVPSLGRHNSVMAPLRGSVQRHLQTSYSTTANEFTNTAMSRRRRSPSILYTDLSGEHPLPEERDNWALSTRTTGSTPFPLKLHETLTQIEKDGLDHIVGWLPHGRSFKIFKQEEFTEIILPRYFVMTKKSSFLRQLNLYSFRRFSAGGSDKGSYYHEKFLRGKKFLSRRMTRQKVNGNRIRSAGNPDEEPDLSQYPVCQCCNDSNTITVSIRHESSSAASLSVSRSLQPKPGKIRGTSSSMSNTGASIPATNPPSSIAT